MNFRCFSLKTSVAILILFLSIPLPFKLYGALNAESAPNWELLRNPILEYPDHSVKDYSVVYRDGVFHIFFSSFHESRGDIRCHVMKTSTTDFISYSPLQLIDDGADADWIGMASPDVTEDEGVYYLTYNSWGDKASVPNQLFYRTSSDLVNWSARSPLAANLTRGGRAIDAAIAHDSGRVFLIWKGDGFRTRMAVSDSAGGRFKFIGAGYPALLMPDGKENGRAHENYQFLRVDGKWMLLSTDYRPHEPFIYELSGSGKNKTDWLKWVNGRRFAIQRTRFNSHDLANASALLDFKSVDGFFYLFFAGNTEVDSYIGRGWNRLGIARSADMTTWESAAESE